MNGRPEARQSRGSMQVLRPLVTIGAVLGSLCVAEPADANGRFPQAGQLIVDPGDPDRLVLRATYGIVVSPNAGADWFIVCEGAVGYGGGEDPAMAVTADGTVLAGVFNGLAASHDGCEWSFVGDPIAEQFVVDVSTLRSNPTTSIAVVSQGGAPGGGFVNRIFRSTDNATSWQQLGVDLDSNLLIFTLDFAAASPDSVYVSARNGDRGVLVKTDDAGGTWTELVIPGTDSSHNPFIGAVHPTNPDILFVRVDGRKPASNPSEEAADDFVLVTTDGGRSWQEVFRGGGKLLGFALSPDGSTVMVGLGDPKTGTVVDDSALGIYRASTSDYVFEKISDGSVLCLTWSGSTVYACGSQFSQGFELGVMSNAQEPSVNPLSGIMEFTDLERLLECPTTSSVGSVCPDAFENTCELLNTCPDGGTEAGATPVGDAGPGSTDANATGARASSGAGGCAVSRSGGGAMPDWLLLLLALASAGIRRRAQSS